MEKVSIDVDLLLGLVDEMEEELALSGAASKQFMLGVLEEMRIALNYSEVEDIFENEEVYK